MAGIIMFPGGKENSPDGKLKAVKGETTNLIDPSEELYRSAFFVPDYEEDCFEDFEDEDYYDPDDDMILEKLRVVDSTAKSILQSVVGKEIPRITFRMKRENLENFAYDSAGYAEYTGKDADDTSYCLSLSFEEKGTALHRQKKGRVPEIFTDDGWEADPDLGEVEQILEEGEADAEFLLAFFNASNSSPFLLKGSFLLRLLSDYRSLIRVREKLGALVQFDVQPYGDGFSVFLVPADERRIGSALTWKNNRFILCQYYSQDDDVLFIAGKGEGGKNSSSFIWDDGWKKANDPDSVPSLKESFTYYEGRRAEKNYKPHSFVQEVGSETSEDKVTRSLRFLWDHASAGMMCCFPVSWDVCAESRNPYKGLKTRFDGEKRKMTDEERAVLSGLRRKFR